MYTLKFDSPWWLILLAALPLIWWVSARTLSGLGRWRRFVAIALRSLIYTLLVAALAEAQWVRKSDRLTVLYLLDQSLSVSQAQTEAMIKYINEAISTQRDERRQDRAGVIVFGREGSIEIPPLDANQKMLRVETMVDRDHTNLAGALKLAQASFPHDTAKRVVILTDGNQNVGDARAQARNLADAGIGIDVVPIRSLTQGDVAVEKVIVPPDVRRGQPYNLSVVLNNVTKEGREPAPISGRLQITRKTGDREQMLIDDEVVVPPGKHRYGIPETLRDPDFYTYEARFIPQNVSEDSMPQNNLASAFTHIRGSGQVLLLEDHENPGEFNFMVDRLRAMNLEVSLRSTRPEELFTDLTQLQPFDTVILGDVPRENFSDEQVDMLIRNTQNLGAGLVLMGGPNSFGAGGWTNTPLEEAMPVDFQIKNAKVKPIGALAMVMHASELPEGNHWQTLVAQEALGALGDEDYCGVLHWSFREEWLWRGGIAKVGGSRRNMLAALDRMTPGDMPDFEPSLKLAKDEFARLPDAAVKHMIVISDGDPSDPDFGPGGAIAALSKMGAKVSTVAIGTHGPAGSSKLQRIATMTGGKYYQVNNAKLLPRIYQKEARKVARPLVFEREAGFQPQIRYPHEMLQGIGDSLPPITGFVLTTPKENPLVEISLVSPVPAGNDVNTILASWTYGLGKSVAFTTDAGARWASAWEDWENYDKLFSQIVRWSMRPTGDTGKFSMSTDVHDGKVRVVVTAQDKNDEFLNFLTPSATVVGPDMKPIELNIKQTAPGRYVGEFDSAKTGSYLVLVSPGPGQAPLRSGVSIPYSDEFRERETNEALLTALAQTTPIDGTPGQLIDTEATANPQDRIAKLLETNTFRHDLAPATNGQGIWHLLVLAASCLFFADVFVRRVSVNLDWLPPLAAKAWDRIRGREARAEVTPTIERLRSRKAEVSDELEQRRAQLRFEPEPTAEVDLDTLSEETAKPTVTPAEAKAKATLTPEKDDDGYTARLLKAKQKARDEQKKDRTDET